MEQRPGTPRLLRELNDRAALELLLAGGPMTRAQVGERTGLSKVTASQLLSRLEERGLVTTVGEQAGGRGPNAALYAVVPSSAYVAGLHVEHDEVSAGVADITGEVVTQVSVDPNGAANPVELVRGAVAAACRSAGVEMSRLNALVIGTPGVLDPSTGDPRLAVNLPAWHEGVLEALRSDLRQPVTIENDVNLAAMAERAVGVAQGADDFVLMWIGVGLGLATIIGGRLHRGVAGAAGEIGYLPVPGVPLPQDVSHPATGAFQSLVGAQAVRPLAESYGFPAPTAAAAVRAAVAAAQAGGDRGGRGQRGARPRSRRARRRGGAGRRDRARRPGGRGGGPDLPGPPPGGADRGERPAGAARRHPGCGGAGPGRAARLRRRPVSGPPAQPAGRWCARWGLSWAGARTIRYG
jgi:predicted NBD/HSP70 family sugar kinase